jgi:hypothetical protein
MSVIIDRSDIPARMQLSIIEDLTIIFPKIMNRKPLLCYRFDEYGNLVAPLDYGLNLCKVNGFQELTDIERYEFDEPYQSTVPLYGRQEDILCEVFEHLNSERTAILAAYTSSGKSMMTTHIIQRMNRPAIIVVSMVELINQWVGEFGASTTAVVRVIGRKGERDKYYYRGVEVAEGGYHVIITMIQRVHRIEEEVRSTIGLLVIDEADQVCSENRIATILTINPGFILLCTATPKRGNNTTDFLTLMCGNRIVTRYREGNHNIQIVKTNITPKIEHRVCTRGNIVTGGANWHVLKQSLYYNDSRNAMIMQLAKEWTDRPLSKEYSMWDKGERIMIATDEVKHVEVLAKMAQNLGLTCSTLTSKTKKKDYKVSQVVIVTYQKAGTGFDEANYLPQEWKGLYPPYSCMIIAFSTKQHYLHIQVSGRIRAANPTIKYMLDSYKTLSRHCDIFIESFKHVERTIEEVMVVSKPDKSYEFVVMDSKRLSPCDED